MLDLESSTEAKPRSCVEDDVPWDDLIRSRARFNKVKVTGR